MTVFKELQLAEGRCTGFPKIRRALKTNGSPPPYFETDDDRTYFMVTLKIHPKAEKELKKSVVIIEEKSAQKSAQKILDIIGQNSFITRAELAKKTGLSDNGVKKQLRILQAKGVLKRIGPDKGGHWEVIK